MKNAELKNKVIKLRKSGKTYGEIMKMISSPIPKSTLSNWCNGIPLSKIQKLRIERKMLSNINKGRVIALRVNKEKREKYLKSVEKRVSYLSGDLKDRNVAKLVMGALYLGEGSKSRHGSLTFGNSSPGIIRAFLFLLRSTYDLDEKKFRCTVQCRADQDVKKLERFWLSVTKIPMRQFYKTRIDPRTSEKTSRKIDYKGVCRIEYFSADLYNELLKIGDLICSIN